MQATASWIPSPSAESQSLVQPRLCPRVVELPLLRESKVLGVLLDSVWGRRPHIERHGLMARARQNDPARRRARPPDSESLGREKERLDKLWLINDAAPTRPETVKAVAAGEAATVLRVPPAALSAWLQPAAGTAGKGAARSAAF